MTRMDAPGQLELVVSPEMQNASASLCDLKLEMDRYSRGFLGQPFLDDWMGSRGTCAYGGDQLLRLVIPFLGWEPREAEAFRAYVDPRHVLGASIKGFPENVREGEVQERITRYATFFGSRDNALYVWYRPLGILTAHEGKHRVAFMRAHGQPAIAAWVLEASYPSAERIRIVEPEDPNAEWLALLDGRYVQLLRRPQVSLMMMRAYGVQVCQWRDLDNAPSRQSVLNEIYRRGLQRPPQTIAEEHRTIDLATLRQSDKADDESVVRNLLELKPYRCLWRRLGIATSAAVALSLVLWQLPWPVARLVAWMCMGTAYGLAFGPMVLRFVGPRRVVGGSAGRNVC